MQRSLTHVNMDLHPEVLQRRDADVWEAEVEAVRNGWKKNE
jgi:hypothetical protein